MELSIGKIPPVLALGRKLKMCIALSISVDSLTLSLQHVLFLIQMRFGVQLLIPVAVAVSELKVTNISPSQDN